MRRINRLVQIRREVVLKIIRRKKARNQRHTSETQTAQIHGGVGLGVGDLHGLGHGCFDGGCHVRHRVDGIGYAGGDGGYEGRDIGFGEAGGEGGVGYAGGHIGGVFVGLNRDVDARWRMLVIRLECLGSGILTRYGSCDCAEGGEEGGAGADVLRRDDEGGYNNADELDPSHKETNDDGHLK